MRVTDNGNYGIFLKEHFMEYTRPIKNYVFMGLVVTALIFYWYNYGVAMMLEFAVTIAMGFTIMILLTDGVSALMFKEFRRNKFITYISLFIILGILIAVFYEVKTILLALAIGLFFMIPVSVLLIKNNRIASKS